MQNGRKNVRGVGTCVSLIKILHECIGKGLVATLLSFILVLIVGLNFQMDSMCNKSGKLRWHSQPCFSVVVVAWMRDGSSVHNPEPIHPGFHWMSRGFSATRCLTKNNFILLEAALGTNASIWIGLQADYNLQKAKQDKSFMNRLEQIRKIAAVL